MVGPLSEPSSESLTPQPKTVEIRIQGRVQGVGFRPFVYRLALALGIRGTVQNHAAGVQIEASGRIQNLKDFYSRLLAEMPAQAKVVSSSFEEKEFLEFPSFRIIESGAAHYHESFITPDFAICAQCREELRSVRNRRYLYPFITCTDCGPRYSIVRTLPFDRGNTAMDVFPLCAACQSEYQDPNDRRFYSQTNSCPDCGPKLTLYDCHRTVLASDRETLLPMLCTALAAKQTLAVKGIGGFLLLCDATSKEAIERLRSRKQRPSKPLAVLYRNLTEVAAEYLVSAEEKEALTSTVAPIVLLRPKQNSLKIARQAIAPDLERIGVFLPYAPLLELILAAYLQPLVATSANISGESILYQNLQALEALPMLADYLLVHNREITMPEDDSVLQFSAEHQTKIILRSGRGLAPHHFRNLAPPQDAFAGGGLLKSSIAFAKSGSVYVSQYLGNTTQYEPQRTYQQVAEQLQSLLGASPEIYLADQHPDYFSTQYSAEKAEAHQKPFLQLQHHKAHLAAVLAENDRWGTDEKFLGVVWDGTGYGEDGHIWGGEFFLAEKTTIRRLSHLAYHPVLAGDKMAKEPRLAALSFCHRIPAAEEVLGKKFSAAEWSYYQKLLQHRSTTIQHSSIGRLFDAVACLIGLDGSNHQQGYEGEAAMKLESLASRYKNKGGSLDEDAYTIELLADRIDVQPMFEALLSDLKNNLPPERLAFKFHQTLVKMIEGMAERENLESLAFSGGAFQNALLVDSIQTRLGKKYRLYFHQKLAPNDENLAFGQIALNSV